MAALLIEARDAASAARQAGESVLDAAVLDGLLTATGRWAPPRWPPTCTGAPRPQTTPAASPAGSPQRLDDVLAEFRRAMAPAGTLVLGLFDGDEVTAFDHKVVTAYRWSVDELVERLMRAGFTEVERLQRPSEGARRPHAAIAAEC
jgi:hypothetical protein